MTIGSEGGKTSAARGRRSRRTAGVIEIMTAPVSSRDDDWRLTYMDTVTLLVTLFVLLLSFSTVSEENYKKVARALDLSKYGNKIVVGEIPEKFKPTMPLPGSGEPIAAKKETAATLAATLNDRLASRGLQDVVQMKVVKNAIDLQMNENVLFPSGQAGLTDAGFAVVRKLVDVLTAAEGNISVEGHTDNLPISTDAFPSNWELSAARAAAVARAMIDQGVAPKRIDIRGYADTRPVATNDTPEGRNKNRRVNLILRLPE